MKRIDPWSSVSSVSSVEGSSFTVSFCVHLWQGRSDAERNEGLTAELPITRITADEGGNDPPVGRRLDPRESAQSGVPQLKSPAPLRLVHNFPYCSTLLA
jgi:hypothetical protein